MSKRATLADISKAMGVSTTTITRALNSKPKVGEELRKSIIETAEKMGYKPNKTAQALVRSQIVIGIVYPHEPAEFWRYLEKGMKKGVHDLMDLKVSGVFKTVKNLNSEQETRDALMELNKMNVDGIILAIGFNYKVYKDIIEEIDAKGIPILFLLNDIEEVKGLGCVRMNGIAAGRIAAQMLDLCIHNDRKSVVVMASNKEVSIHQACIQGFLDEAGRNGLNIKGIYETYDDKGVAYCLAEKVISEIPDLGGIYVSSYNSVAICNYIEEHNLTDKITVIGQDLYPKLVEKLINGSLKATLFQDPTGQGINAVKKLYRCIAEGEQGGDILTTPLLVLKSNVDCYKDKY